MSQIVLERGISGDTAVGILLENLLLTILGVCIDNQPSDVEDR